MPRAERPARADTGARAEALAAAFLVGQGLAIAARNFRTRLGEIDLVACERDTLVFVEVRYRATAAFGGAAASITPAKRARMRAAADAYLATLLRVPACRFDAILLDKLAPARITWVRDILDD